MWPFNRKKNYVELTYQFLCRRCDFFFYKNNPDDCRCPNCNSVAEVYDVFKKEEKDGRE